MKFTLFLNEKLEFEVNEPVALVECYCFQTNFYHTYDLLPERGFKDVGRIGARKKENWLSESEYNKIISEARVRILNYNNELGLDRFLKMSDEKISACVKELCKHVIKKIMRQYVRLSRATKILHTCYPYIIPIIDDMLQKEYRREINQSWKEENPSQILIDYYLNLKEPNNRQNLNKVFDDISKNNLGLTKVRVFDILWWSYLKAKRVQEAGKAGGISISFSMIR